MPAGLPAFTTWRLTAAKCLHAGANGKAVTLSSVTQSDNSKMLSTKAVAGITGKSERWVRELCKKSDVPAEKTNKGWLIRESGAKKIVL